MAEEEEGRGENGYGEERRAAAPEWPTVDGALGAHPDTALNYARTLFYAGFLLLPWLWFMNCFYFWPVLRFSTRSPIRFYVFWSGVGFISCTALLLSWAVIYASVGERLLGPRLWKRLAVYNIADELQLF